MNLSFDPEDMVVLSHGHIDLDQRAPWVYDNDELKRLVTLAQSVIDSYLNDGVRSEHSHLFDLWGGGAGRLAHLSGEKVSYDTYLGLLQQFRIEDATKAAKRKHTERRRSQFDGVRSDLVLAMIEAGHSHKCQAPLCLETEDLTVDHMVPLSRGGTDELENLQFLCRHHNSAKGDRV